jgi:hypothetical protein
MNKFNSWKIPGGRTCAESSSDARDIGVPGDPGVDMIRDIGVSVGDVGVWLPTDAAAGVWALPGISTGAGIAGDAYANEVDTDAGDKGEGEGDGDGDGDGEATSVHPSDSASAFNVRNLGVLPPTWVGVADDAEEADSALRLRKDGRTTGRRDAVRKEKEATVAKAAKAEGVEGSSMDATANGSTYTGNSSPKMGRDKSCDGAGGGHAAMDCSAASKLVTPHSK